MVIAVVSGKWWKGEDSLGLWKWGRRIHEFEGLYVKFEEIGSHSSYSPGCLRIRL